MCWGDKCKCGLTFSSVHHVEFVDFQCLMSKYGPCNINKNIYKVTVGCLDGFQCIEGQCRDPNSTAATIPSEKPYQFEKLVNDGCTFLENVELLGTTETDESLRKCICKISKIADGPAPAWRLYNYAGASNCSSSQFGPCGELNGLKLDCYGKGIECVNGRCMNPKKLISNKCESCEEAADCAQGLLCSSLTCIPPKSLSEGAYCTVNETCMNGLKCRSEFPASTCQRV